MKCYLCKNETQIKFVKKYQYKESGLDNVYLSNIEVRSCDKCNLASPIIPQIIRLHNTIALAIILKPSLLFGEEIRFLRKNLRVKAQDWAKYLRKDIATVSRAEKTGNIQNKDFDILIRFLYVRLWEEKNEQIFGKKIIEVISNIENQEFEILIDVNEIDSYSHFEREEIWDEEVYSPKFETNNFEKSDFTKKAILKGESVKFNDLSPFYLDNYYAAS